MHAIDEPEEPRLLRQHAADEHDIGPVDVRVRELPGVQIGKTELPAAGEKSRHGDQSEG